MAVKAFREVGECGCYESQVGTRMRELVRSLQEDLRDARRLIDELTRGRGSGEVGDSSSTNDLSMSFDSPHAPAMMSQHAWTRPY